MRKIILILSFAYSTLNMGAQSIKNSYIVDLKEGTSETFESNHRLHSITELTKFKVLSSTLDIVQIEVKNEGDKALEAWLDQNNNVESWGYNYYVQKRKTPNDEYFNLQWDLELIRAADAWDVTTGGTDILGNEIVVAVLDESFELTHPELEGRIFNNSGEIPNDGIDNDNNGYVDDFVGWNTTDDNDDHPITDNHGTAVSGIIGAKTNNELGIAGINWQLKILPISGIATQAEVIGGYQYVLNMRSRYNESDGAEGAYIVITNYSAGIDNASGTDPQFKSWCDMYDALGHVGVLSAGATANRNINVDADGDMPTTCPSQYLMAITNVDSEDSKVSNAGYGEINIDIGAPGKGTLALDINAGYDQSFGGTSAATPHISGAVALLYSVPCSTIANLAKQNPSQAAEIIRDAIYDGAADNSTLEGITVTGGRLDIFGAIENLQSTCDIILPSPKGELEIKNVNRQDPSSYRITYVTQDENVYSFLLTDRIGRTLRHFDFNPPTIGRKELKVDMPELIPGIYFISIYNEDTISTQKIFIE